MAQEKRIKYHKTLASAKKAIKTGKSLKSLGVVHKMYPTAKYKKDRDVYMTIYIKKKAKRRK